MLKILLIAILWCISTFVGILMMFFLRFHIRLVSENKTTIENLDMKNKPFQSKFDLGSEYNLYQVFGTNKLLWPFPIYLDSGKP